MKPLLSSGLVSALNFTSFHSLSSPFNGFPAAASVLSGFRPFLCLQVVGAPITTQVFPPSSPSPHLSKMTPMGFYPEPATKEAMTVFLCSHIPDEYDHLDVLPSLLWLLEDFINLIMSQIEFTVKANTNRTFR